MILNDIGAYQDYGQQNRQSLRTAGSDNGRAGDVTAEVWTYTQQEMVHNRKYIDGSIILIS